MSTSAQDVLAAARQLETREQPYALVSVLRVQPPASARPGDKAVVTVDGIASGWIGGGCAQPAVLRTVRQALADGRARMIRIAPAEEGAVRELDDVLEFGMACHSGGTIELFVDPVLPRARLVVIGDSPVAAALASLAPRVGFQVGVIAHGADAARFPDAQPIIASDHATTLADQVAPGSFVVVATQGRRDVQGLRAALALRAHTVWFVASARKAQVLRDSLVESGADADAVRAIVAPAGQPIGARTPEEIALSVLAAVVAARRGAAPRRRRTPRPPAQRPRASRSTLILPPCHTHSGPRSRRCRRCRKSPARAAAVQRPPRRLPKPSRWLQRRRRRSPAADPEAMGCILKGGGGLYSRLVVGAVLLAAGGGLRIGGRPKCLLELGGVPLIRRQLIALSGAGVDEVVVVLGHHADQIEPVIAPFPVTIVRNPDPDQGQVSSQRIGLAALTGKLDAVLVALADQPLVNAQDITALIGAYKKRPEGTSVAFPQVNGEPGNPVIFSAEVRDEILAGAASVGCRQWRDAHPQAAAPFVTDNRRYKVDIDTLEDIQRFERDTGHALRWPASGVASSPIKEYER